ncbi:ExeM/NucH family extracellular endonuclease [Nocardioides sambongensis]|uniref:ExeM/NucH family extracellular endonuclease n=1 Tax=Nocardioides sambongensis TaxID=2589074 RepID=UPI0011289FEA|nr:ExeM/NucH family extracellular endonuclease [Nocardioides sambongensis]
MHLRRNSLAAAAVAALSIGGLAAVTPAAQANPAGTGLVISEVYGGGGNGGATWTNDFIELYNPTDAPISVEGHSVQYRSATGTSAQVTPLSGSVPPGGHYLVQEAAGAGGTSALPTPDASAGIAMSGSNGVVLLVGSTTAVSTTGDLAGSSEVLDAVGYGATPGTYETARTGVELTATTAASRTDGADTDQNANDFAEGAPTPTNAAGETQPPVSDTLTATDPADLDLTVDEPMGTVQLEATGGTAPYTWSSTPLPNGLSLSAAGEVSGTPTAVGTTTVTFTVGDAEGATSSVDVDVEVSGPPQAVAIAQVQGNGASSPLAGQDVVVEGIVTGVYADPYDAEPGMANYGGLDGFFLQTAGTGGTTDATPAASDGIFVSTGNDVPTSVELGASVEVAGTVQENFGTTRLIAPVVTALDTALQPVTPLEIAYPTTEAGREAQEGMLLAPTDDFTVTNSYGTNQYGEVGLATGDSPLLQPSDVAAPASPAYDAVVADNAARGVVLDDGTSINYLSNGSAQQDYSVPWLTLDNPVRVGARATLTGPVILNYDFDVWRFQPTEPVLDEGSDVAVFEDTRVDNATPQDVGGEVKLATFNVLNYFNTTAEDFVANGGSCTYYTDRDGNRIGANQCSPNGPRGAATDASLQRQQDKIVAAINGLGADVVTLEELENSIKLLGETDRDDAIADLVEALNEDAGSATWAYVPSPAEATTAANVAQQDVIRSGYIYKPATVAPVGESDILFDTSAFENAREPLAQVFAPVGGEPSDSFAVVVNHFKSKGCTDASGDNADAGDGQSCYNGDRVRQAGALVDFVADFTAAAGVEKVFLTGDFNSYTFEDPMMVLDDAGYSVVESDQEGDWSYSYQGLSGSLDHVLANEPALADVSGADVWEINANESVAFQYSRFNYNVTPLYAADQFAASDHNPEIVGIDPGEVAEPLADSRTSARTTPKKVVAGKTRVKVHVRVRADGAAAAGRVEVRVAGHVYRVRLKNGAGTVRLKPFGSAGKKVVQVRYLGNATTEASRDTVTVKVVKAKRKGRR